MGLFVTRIPRIISPHSRGQMGIQSSPESKSEAITTEGSVAAFMEMILNTSLPLKPSSDPPVHLQQLIAKQVHAVVVLYNYYQRKRHPELQFLGFESFCKLAANLQPELVPYMKGMHKSNYKSSDVPEDQLSLTEKAIMDACKVCLALYDVPEDMPVKEEWPISKIVIILEGTVARKKRRRISKKDTGEEQNITKAGFEQLAVSAIKNFTGLKKIELVFLESHVVYSVSKEKTAARFYIVKCAVKFPDKLNITYWVPLKEVVESLQGPLANWLRLIGEWTPTSVTQSYHLLPYAEILSNYFSRLGSSHEGEHERTIGDKSQASQELRPDTENEVSSGCLNDLGGMLSTSNSNTNETSDATIMSPDKEGNNGTDMAGLTCSVRRLHTVNNDETDAVSTPKEDKTKNDRTDGKVYQHYRKRNSTRRDVTVSNLSVEHKIVAADLEVKQKVQDFKADKQGSVKKVPESKVDKLHTVNKSCNNISVKQNKMSIGDGAVVPFQMNSNSPEKVQTTCFAKEKELSVANKEKALSMDAFMGLLSKRDILTHQLRNLGDEIAICDKTIQKISDNGKDSLPVKIDTFVDRCTDVCVERKSVQDGTFQHAKDHVSSEQMKGKSIIEALIPDQIFCQVLDRICHDNKWTSPTYSISPCDGGYIANVTVKGDDFEWLVNDRVHSCPKDAKDSAAMQMIEKLRSLI
ncbi:hypothetical protein POM88_026030 [Heracleum sosnowskyi]|uniref:DRBM domain-containing protein n=1 Tax=Heracleum sosnowskyi TaxID=360622 RepID=A0AAD8I662_9APIA|nr:hypothetical protein POM88_026030 [Heracleum sosnowskyi]